MLDYITIFDTNSIKEEMTIYSTNRGYKDIGEALRMTETLLRRS